jgi:protein-L-isoaspartate(D-aspartate) O-methyltransferase
MIQYSIGETGEVVMASLTSGRGASEEMTSIAARRKEMVERDIAARGVRDQLVLDAMGKVPRELFLPARLRDLAYGDSPLPIGGAQTISQPYIVALMAEALELKGGEKILEIGTGSGYAAAVLSEIAGEVYTVERLGQLAETAAVRLADLGYANVHILHGDGTRGWPDHAPFDAIVVAAGGPRVPESLKSQLKVGGRLVIPVGTDRCGQELVRLTRVSDNEYRSEDLADVRFVPLLGEEGWATGKQRPGLGRLFRALRHAATEEANAATPQETAENEGLPDSCPFGR